MPNPLPAARMRDADAVAKAREGQADGLSYIYEDHAKLLYRLIYRLTASSADAEDILHDLFVALPELLRRYEDRGKLGAWLRQVATRMTLMRLRAERRRREVPIDAVASEIAAPDGESDASLIERAMLALPHQQRQVFVLRQLEGFSYDEISALLDISPGAARVRHLRALRRIRRQLEKP
jgi:RNA polymerase sigma factor (sigma-70 family)